MTFGFLSGSRNFCKLLWVSCEVFVLHGYAWIHWVARSCTTTAYRWLFRDSQLSLRTLWSAVIKSPKIFRTRYSSTVASSAWGPCNFGPFTDLAISVFRELSFNTVITPNPHVSWIWALKILHEKNWRESLRVLEFHHPPKFPWILNIGSLRSFVNRSWHVHWRDVTLNSISSFSSLNFTYCRWRRRGWRRWWAMTLLSWRCLWSWWRSRGRIWQAWNHNSNEIFRVAGYPNPVFNEMWFLTIDPFVRIPVFIAKLSDRQYCWRVFEDFHSQRIYSILWHTQLPLHASALLHWRMWLS